MNLYQLLAKEGKNTFFSPFSLSTALAMVFCGSENETAEEIRLAIGYNVGNITDDNIKSGFQQLLSTLEKTPDNYVLNYANSLLSQKGFAVKEEYKLTIQESFRALSMEVDFVGESEKVISHINEWETIFPSANDAMAVAQANNHLSVNLYRVLSKEDGNVFFSPFSLSTALAMLFCGSKSSTSQEMREVLGYEVANIPDENIKSSFQQLLSVLEKTPDNYILCYANSLLSQKDFNVKEEYKTVLEESFKALLMEVDFVHESQNVVSQINNWVKDKTNNMIPQLLDSLDPATVLVILNAVYFKGNWLNKFNEKATFLQYFYNKGMEDNAVQVDMMHLKESFPYLENESFKAVQLPYKGEEIAMLILLPKSRNGLEEVENKLSSNFIQDFKQNMRKMKIELALPKFRLEYSKSMKNAFQELGMKRVFECGADLSGINDSKQLNVSEIIHKAVVVVNEEGS
ncbi:putative serpin-like protein, partial [Stegodyphus mimosarum]